MNTPAERLIASIQQDDEVGVRSAIADQPDFTSRIDEVTPLYWAIHCNRIDFAKLILEAGANPDDRVGMDSTPLMGVAATRTDLLSDEESTRFAELLIEFGAKVVPRSDSGHAVLPLPMARLRGKVRLAELLAKNGAYAIDTVIRLVNDTGEPLQGDFYYGPCYSLTFSVGTSDSSGILRLESVIEGEFIVGQDSVRHTVSIQRDGTALPKVLVWRDAT